MNRSERISIAAIGLISILIVGLAAWQALAAAGCSFAVSGKGRKPATIVCPGDVSMPDVAVGASRDTILVIRNTGQLPWSGTLSLDAQAVQAYSIVAGGGQVTITGKGSWSFTLRFTPPDTLAYACRPRAQ